MEKEDAYNFTLSYKDEKKSKKHMPEWLLDKEKFYQYWDRVQSAKEIDRFKESIIKRQSEFKGLVF